MLLRAILLSDDPTSSTSIVVTSFCFSSDVSQARSSTSSASSSIAFCTTSGTDRCVLIAVRAYPVPLSLQSFSALTLEPRMRARRARRPISCTVTLLLLSFRPLQTSAIARDLPSHDLISGFTSASLAKQEVMSRKILLLTRKLDKQTTSESSAWSFRNAVLMRTGSFSSSRRAARRRKLASCTSTASEWNLRASRTMSKPLSLQNLEAASALSLIRLTIALSAWCCSVALPLWTRRAFFRHAIAPSSQAFSFPSGASCVSAQMAPLLCSCTSSLSM
mmetsp:Transcript_48172/g.151138  ORF Transcript_48172/g.151138 Transcript_48172/m.151138 type:complete len:277 (+) Transcript_48172:614-1444(+)